MRLWSINPGYLDSKGLLALWREALLAKKVLQGKTRGYRGHPQLIRFREQPDHVASMRSYLLGVWEESCRRGFCFDRRKIGQAMESKKMTVTDGQLAYEFNHLKAKLRSRCLEKYRKISNIKSPRPHPLFRTIKGPVEDWEKRKK
jgi:hypothetical protein